jgi:transcriptional regulator with XRE-family HTH domain
MDATQTSEKLDNDFDTWEDRNVPIEQKKEMLAEYIKDKMKAANLRSSQLAKEANKQPSEITKWLSGKHNFTIESLFLLEKVLDLPIINLGHLEKALRSKAKLAKVSCADGVFRKSIFDEINLNKIATCVENNRMGVVGKIVNQN